MGGWEAKGESSVELESIYGYDEFDAAVRFELWGIGPGEEAVAAFVSFDIEGIGANDCDYGSTTERLVLFASGDSGLQELGQVELKNSGYRVYCDEDGRTEQWTALESRAFAEPVAEGIFPLVRVRPEGVLRCQWSKKGYLCPEEETPICGASAKEEGCTKAEFELDAQGHVLVFKAASVLAKWYADGVSQLVGRYDAARKGTGPWRVWHANGMVRKVEIFEAGAVQSERRFDEQGKRVEKQP